MDNSGLVERVLNIRLVVSSNTEYVPYRLKIITLVC